MDYDKITQFNQIYGLPTPSRPHLHPREKVENFVSILKDEIDEVYEILEDYEKNPLESLVKLADWFGDLIIYCQTKACEFGLPMQEVLEVIMISNFSKLGSDGKPLKDNRGKVLKGPNFIPPEDLIREILKEKLEAFQI